MAEPTWRDLFLDSWRYDRFANLEWLEPVRSQGSEEDRRVFGHILSASKIWAMRLHGVSPNAMPVVPLEAESIEEIFQSWATTLARLEFDRIIDYANTKGQAGSRTVGDIARHALNHGTYHRGQLRESFGQRGLEFPETDFIFYSYMRDEQ